MYLSGAGMVLDTQLGGAAELDDRYDLFIDGREKAMGWDPDLGSNFGATAIEGEGSFGGDNFGAGAMHPSEATGHWQEQESHFPADVEKWKDDYFDSIFPWRGGPNIPNANKPPGNYAKEAVFRGMRWRIVLTVESDRKSGSMRVYHWVPAPGARVAAGQTAAGWLQRAGAKLRAAFGGEGHFGHELPDDPMLDTILAAAGGYDPSMVSFVTYSSDPEIVSLFNYPSYDAIFGDDLVSDVFVNPSTTAVEGTMTDVAPDIFGQELPDDPRIEGVLTAFGGYDPRLLEGSVLSSVGALEPELNLPEFFTFGQDTGPATNISDTGDPHMREVHGKAGAAGGPPGGGAGGGGLPGLSWPLVIVGVVLLTTGAVVLVKLVQAVAGAAPHVAGVVSA